MPKFEVISKDEEKIYCVPLEILMSIFVFYLICLAGLLGYSTKIDCYKIKPKPKEEK